MCRCDILHPRAAEADLLFQQHVRNDDTRTTPVMLKAVCGPGDKLKPVITFRPRGQD